MPNELKNPSVRPAFPSDRDFPFPRQVGLSRRATTSSPWPSTSWASGGVHEEVPGSNPKDVEFFSRWTSSGLADRAAAGGTKLAAFGMTRRRGVTADDDEGLKALTDCLAPCVCIVAKAWDEQCEKVLGVSPEENIAMIEESVAHLVAAGKEVMVDCEHDFDVVRRPGVWVNVRSRRPNRARNLSCCARRTGTLPWDVEEFTREEEAVDATGAGVRWGFTATTTLARRGQLHRGGQGRCDDGAGVVNGTASGRVTTCSSSPPTSSSRWSSAAEGSQQRLTQVSAAVAKLCSQHQDPRQPYMGSSAFAHKGGLHVAFTEDAELQSHRPIAGWHGRGPSPAERPRQHPVGRDGVGPGLARKPRQVLSQIKDLESAGSSSRMPGHRLISSSAAPTLTTGHPSMY